MPHNQLPEQDPPNRDFVPDPYTLISINFLNLAMSDDSDEDSTPTPSQTDSDSEEDIPSWYEEIEEDDSQDETQMSDEEINQLIRTIFSLPEEERERIIQFIAFRKAFMKKDQKSFLKSFTFGLPPTYYRKSYPTFFLVFSETRPSLGKKLVFPLGSPKKQEELRVIPQKSPKRCSFIFKFL